MIKRMATPDPRLQSCIDRYWCWQPAAGTTMPALLPGTGAEIWFHLAARPTTAGGLLPAVHLVATRQNRHDIQFTGASHLIAVRFRNPGLFSLFGVPLDALVDQHLALDDWLMRDRLLSVERLQQCNGWLEQVAVLDDWLLQCRQRRPEAAFTRQVEQLYYQQAVASNEMSSRRFQRLFRQYTGVSARRFQRLTRFQRLVRHLLIEGDARYLQQALAEGYYDQAHFINDFRALTGEAPGRFLTADNFAHHFYQHSVLPGLFDRGVPR